MHLWGLTDYTRIIYVDADTMVVRNIDHLFDRSLPLAKVPGGTNPQEKAEKFAGVLAAHDKFAGIFNSGVMVLAPSQKVIARMLAVYKDTPSYNIGDQGFLNVGVNNLTHSCPRCAQQQPLVVGYACGFLGTHASSPLSALLQTVFCTLHVHAPPLHAPTAPCTGTHTSHARVCILASAHCVHLYSMQILWLRRYFGPKGAFGCLASTTILRGWLRARGAKVFSRSVLSCTTQQRSSRGTSWTGSQRTTRSLARAMLPTSGPSGPSLLMK